MTREAIREADLNIRRAEQVLAGRARLKTSDRLSVLAVLRRVRYAKSANNTEDIRASTAVLSRVLAGLHRATAAKDASGKRRGPYRGPGSLRDDEHKEPYHGC